MQGRIVFNTTLCGAFISDPQMLAHRLSLARLRFYFHCLICHCFAVLNFLTRHSCGRAPPKSFYRSFDLRRFYSDPQKLVQPHPNYPKDAFVQLEPV